MSASLLNRGITIADPDGRGGEASVSLSASAGTIAINVGTSGVTYTSGTGTATVLFHGTIAELDNFFRGRTTATLIYAKATIGDVVFTLIVTDEDGLATTITFNGTVADFASPVVSVPGGTINVATGQVNNLHGIGFNVSDSDDSGNYATMVIGVNHGTLSCTAGNSGVTVTTGNGTASVTLVGTIDSLSKFLAASGGSTGLFRYSPTVVGSKTLTITVTDSQGQVGANTKSIVVKIAPTVTSPSGYIPIVTTVITDLAARGFSYADSDASGTQSMLIHTDKMQIQVVAGNSGVTIVSGNLSGSDSTAANVTVSGTITQLNNLLQGIDTGVGSAGNILCLRSTDAPASAPVTLTITITDDTGLTGSGSVTVVSVTGTVWTGYATATPLPTDVSLTNFVAPIDLSLLPAAWWAAVSEDGRDIRVTNDSNTQSPADLVPSTFNKTNKTGLLFAKISNSTTAPTLRVWVGASGASALAHGATYGQDAVYDTSVIKAWWASGGGLDRSANANHLTLSGSAGEHAISSGIQTYYTSYSGGGGYGKATAAVENDIPEQFVCFVRPTNIGSEMHYAGSTHGTIRNILGQNNSKARGKTDIQGGTDNATYSAGNIVAGAWQQVWAAFYATNLRLAGRSGGFFGNNTGTSAGVAGGDAYITGGIGTDVAGTVGAASNLNGDVGLSIIFKYGSADSAKFNAWIKNYANAYSQSSYWSAWTWDSSTTVTGL